MSQHFTSSSLRKGTGAPICQDVKHLEVIAWKAPATEERYCWESLSGVDAASVIGVSPSPSPSRQLNRGSVCREVPISRVLGDFLLHQALLLLAQLHCFEHKQGTVRLAWRGLRRKAECRPAKPAGCRFVGRGEGGHRRLGAEQEGRARLA